MIAYVFISGPPGAGKSTTAQHLARDNGFVYFEADAFFMFCNPFNPINHDNPSMATLEQKPLKVGTWNISVILVFSVDQWLTILNFS